MYTNKVFYLHVVWFVYPIHNISFDYCDCFPCSPSTQNLVLTMLTTRSRLSWNDLLFVAYKPVFVVNCIFVMKDQNKNLLKCTPKTFTLSHLIAPSKTGVYWKCLYHVSNLWWHLHRWCLPGLLFCHFDFHLYIDVLSSLYF